MIKIIIYIFLGLTLSCHAQTNALLLLSKAGADPPTFSAVYDSVYQNFTNKPSLTYANIQDTMLLMLLDSGNIYGITDRFFVFQNEINTASEALIDWIHPSTNFASLVNTPSFTSNEGFTGNGTNAAINLNYNPRADGLNYAVGDGCIAIFSGTSAAADVVYLGAATSGGFETVMIQPAFSGTTMASRFNSNDVATWDHGQDADGFFALNQPVTGEWDMYANNSNTNTVTATSDAPDEDIHVFAFNVGGTLQNFAASQVRLVWIGDALSATQIRALENIFNWYNLRLDKSVD
jgi:hypothetical protein